MVKATQQGPLPNRPEQVMRLNQTPDTITSPCVQDTQRSGEFVSVLIYGVIDIPFYY